MSRIKGITVEIGGDTTGLDKALGNTNKKIRDTQSELKDVERLLKLDPENTELLRQKFNLLNDSISDTEEKLDGLRDAEKQVQKQFENGDISERQYDSLKREIEATEIALRKIKEEATETNKKIKKVDDKPIEDVAEAADKAEEQLREAGKEADNFSGYLKANVITEGAKTIVEGLKDIAEETKEYQKIMGSLEVSSEKAGYTTEETREAYKKLYGVLGDDQSAATTVANLQALKLPQEKLLELIDNTIGAWSTYGDSIPIDGLAEAINETAKVGTVTGVFADALNWAGMSEDDFNEKLATAKDEAERTNMIMQALSEQGLSEAGEAWQENNQALVENNQANADLQEQVAELGEKVLPVITEITECVANALEWFNSLDSGTQTMILSFAAVLAAVGPLTSAIGGLGTMMSFIAANPIVALIVAIVGLVVLLATKGDEIQACMQRVDDFLQNIFAKDWTEVFGPVIGDSLNAFFATVKNIWDAVKKIFDGIIDFVRGVFTGDWERAWNGVKEIFSGIFDGLVSVAKIPLNGIIGSINGGISGINTMISGLNGIKVDIPDWVPGLGGKSFGFNIPEIGKIPYLAKGGILSSGSAVVGEAGPELLTVSGNSAKVEPLTNATTNNSHLGSVNMYIYGAPGQSVDELAEKISEKMNSMAERNRTVFA